MPGAGLPALPFPHGEKPKYPPRLYGRTAQGYGGAAEHIPSGTGLTDGYSPAAGTPLQAAPDRGSRTHVQLIFVEKTGISGDFRGENYSFRGEKPRLFLF